MTIEVEEWYDGDGKLNLTISWDDTDPIESQFNDWTEQDFLTAIKNACDDFDEQKLSVGGEVCTDKHSVVYPPPGPEEGVLHDC